MKRIVIILLFLFSFGAPAIAFASDIDHILLHDGIQRAYFVHTPPDYRPKAKKLPMVIVMHGGGGDAQGIIRQTGMNDVADKNDFIVVYPEGAGAGPKDKFHTWNAGRCCGSAMEKNIDDVGFISQIINAMAQNYNIDRKRVYATGHSNGSMMAYRLACELSDKITAIAPNAGQSVIDGCKQSRPVPILHFHGTADKCALYNGGAECGGCFASMMGGLGRFMKHDKWACDPVPESLAAHAKANGCSAETKVIFTQGDTVCERWQDCPAGASVTLCTMNGAGHVWARTNTGEAGARICTDKPESKFCTKWQETVGPANHDFDASALMWKFFSLQSMP